MGHPWSLSSSAWQTARSTRDRDRRFGWHGDFFDLVTGSYGVTVSLDNGDTGQADAVVTSAGSTTVSISLASMAIVSGSVTDTSGNPIASATVILQSTSDSNLFYTTQTDDQGTYSLTGIAPGIYEAIIFSDGYQAMVQSQLAVSGSTSFGASLAASTTTISGKLVDTSNNPIPAGEVLILNASGLTLGSAHVNQDGDFQITSAQGTNLKLSIFAEGYMVPSQALFSATPGTQVSLGSIVLVPVAMDPGGSGIDVSVPTGPPSWVSSVLKSFNRDPNELTADQVQPLGDCIDCAALRNDVMTDISAEDLLFGIAQNDQLALRADVGQAVVDFAKSRRGMGVSRVSQSVP